MGLAFVATATTPLLADFADSRTHRRVVGLAAVLLNTESLNSTLPSEVIDTGNDIPTKDHYLGGVGLVLGVIITLGQWEDNIIRI